jgi:pimeloyl-ACP methyl ester carboxylesterase
MNEPPELPGVRHEYLDIGRLRMHVALSGPEDAPPILLVHGWPQNWWAWRHVIEALAERFRVIAPDLRGHGWSAAPVGGYEKDQLATDLLAVLDILGIERTTWIGHDWGAWTGYIAAIRAPERFERMLALAVPHPWTPSHPRQLALLAYQGPVSLPFLGKRVARPMTRAVLQAGRFGDPISAGDLKVFVDHLPPAVTVAMYRTFLTREVLPLARGRYANEVLRVPTTMLVGAHDLVTRGARPGPVAGQPELSVGIVDRVAHWIPEQRPAAILDWAFAEST